MTTTTQNTTTAELIERIPDMPAEDIKAIYLTLGTYPREVIRAAGDELRFRRRTRSADQHGSSTGLTSAYRYLSR